MNLNPLSPLTGTPLDECSARELDAWIALRLGLLNVGWNIEFSDWVYSKTIDTLAVYPVARYGATDIALGLMEHDVWPVGRCLCRAIDEVGFTVYDNVSWGPHVATADTAPLAICKAWIIAVEAKENNDVD